MSNNTISASATGLPTRRALVAGASAAAIACPLSSANGADYGELGRLISAHRAAYQAFHDAVVAQQEREQAYKAAYPKRILIPTFIGQYHELTTFGRDGCAKAIAQQHERQRQTLGALERMAPEVAEQARVVIDEKEKETYAEMDRIIAEEDARQEEFGLGPATRKASATGEAEDAAAIALMAYRCQTIEEARTKANYLRSSALYNEVDESEIMEAFVGSFLG
jgi:hypothetical protein